MSPCMGKLNEVIFFIDEASAIETSGGFVNWKFTFTSLSRAEGTFGNTRNWRGSNPM